MLVLFMVGSFFIMEVQCLILCANQRFLARSVIAFGFVAADASDAADATNDYAAAVVICMVQRSVRYCLSSSVLATASCGCPQRAVNAENGNLGVPVGHAPRY